jgi:PAS domain S-box-containing protein
LVSQHTTESATVTPNAGKDQLESSTSAGGSRQAERLAELEYLRAVRPGVDHVLQELVDEVRGMFGTDLCMVDLALSDVQYFRAWSGELPPDKAEARQDPLENSMCQYVVNDEMPLVVRDFLETREYREQYWCVNYGIRFYAGTPLITSAGHAIGTLCLLSTRPSEFGEEQMRVLGAFARAVVGRLEMLGALEREQAAREEETQRSQELQQTLDSLSAHIAIVDESGEIIAVNEVWRAFARSNGGDPGMVSEGANYLRVCDSAMGLYAEEADTFAEGIRAVLSGRRDSFEMEYPCHSPTERRWFMGRVTRFSGSGTPRAVIAHENITGRKLAEEQTLFQARLLDQVQAAVIATDLDGTVIHWSAHAESLYGFSREETLGRNISELTVGPTEAGLANEIMERLRSGETWEGEFTVRRKDGSTFPAYVIDSVIHDSRGREIGIVGVSTDITERKRAEEERDRLRVREIEARSQREERRRIARDLHDVVLQDLAGTLQSLRLTHLRARRSDLDLEEELQALRRATSGLRSAIYDLRHERERPFVKSVESLVELNRQLTPERNVALEIEEGFPKVLPAEVGVELLRVLQEALTNTRRHSRARSVEVGLRAEGDAVLAGVIDDGRGFDTGSVRAGVGLSAMRERVEALGGEIEVKSRPGQGTEVTVRVPLGDGTPAPRRL